MGSTGNLPVPPGHWPGGMGGSTALERIVGKKSVPSSLPRGESPRGTGRLPVLPGGFAAATSEFGFNALKLLPAKG
jgi:hypothetical protein